MSAIASSVGYESISALHKAFKRSLGITPGEYRREHAPDNGGGRSDTEGELHHCVSESAAADVGV